MARKKAQKKQETTLVSHRTPNLSVLRERAQNGDSARAVKAYLDAGGSPMSLVPVIDGDCTLQLPLLHFMVLFNVHPHKELAESVKLLVEAGADINTLSGPHGDQRTVLMCASQSNCCAKAVQIFLQHGADILISEASSTMALNHTDASLMQAKRANWWIALMYAVKFGSIDAVKVLHEHGADISAVRNREMTPLMVASEAKRVDMAVFLLKAGADVNALDSTGRSALVVAVQHNCVPIVQLLLNHGADINIVDRMCYLQLQVKGMCS
jgi:ankyrin repeat protein